MKARLLTFIIGAAAGALAMFLMNRPTDNPSAGQTEEPKKPLGINPDRQEQKIAALEKKIAELEVNRPKLLAESGEGEENGSANPKSPTIKIFGSGESKIDLAEMQKHMQKAEKERSVKRVAAKLASLTRTLNLSDEQAEKVHALIAKQEAAKGDRLGGIMKLATTAIEGGDADSLISGFVSDVDGAGDGDDFDFDSELLALLEPDQATAYQDYITSQNENYIEANANRQLAQLQTTVPDMSKEQKDEAFTEFARLAREDVEANGTPDNEGRFDVARMMQHRKAETAAMEAVLTPEQLDVYKSNRSRNITFGATPGATIITSEITIDSSDSAIELAEPE